MVQSIIQAVHILKVKKSEDDVAISCNMCSRLSMDQIIKLLSLYTPLNDLEDTIPINSIPQSSQRIGKESRLAILLQNPNGHQVPDCCICPFQSIFNKLGGWGKN